MKNRFLKVLLKSLGILLALSGIIVLIIYTQLWNPHVEVSVQNEGTFPLTSEQRLLDFNYLYDTLEEGFPYFEVKKRQYGIEWLELKDEFIKRIESIQSDEEYYQALEEFLMLLQNGHTNIIAPGMEYKDYKELYRGPQPWSQVYNNPKVEACYRYWETIIPQYEPAMIPIAFRYIEGHYYAGRNLINPSRLTNELGVPVGSQLLKIDDTDVEQYITGLKTQRMLRFDTARKKYKLSQFSIRTEKETQLTFSLPSGEVRTKVLKPYRKDTMGDKEYTLPEHLFSTDTLAEGRISYLKIPSMSASYVEKDRDALRTYFESIKDVEALIIDIRGNGGGSNNYWMDNMMPLLTDKPLTTRNYLLFRDSAYIQPFLKQKMFFSYMDLKPLNDLSFSKNHPGYYFQNDDGVYKSLEYDIKPDRPVGFKGRIILLVDDYVYSAAEAFAVFAKASDWATLVGTRTGGDGIGFDPVPVALPYSGLVVRFPADMGLNPDGSVNEETATEPDIFVEPSYEDFIQRMNDGIKPNQELSAEESLPYDTVLREAVRFVLSNE